MSQNKCLPWSASQVGLPFPPRHAHLEMKGNKGKAPVARKPSTCFCLRLVCCLHLTARRDDSFMADKVETWGTRQVGRTAKLGCVQAAEGIRKKRDTVFKAMNKKRIILATHTSNSSSINSTNSQERYRKLSSSQENFRAIANGERPLLPQAGRVCQA